MSTKLYVGNLSFNTAEDMLRESFSQFGTVLDVHMVMDKFTGRSRGFAFVTMETPQGAQKAIESMNGQSLDGRTLTVNEARPREERPSGGGGFEKRSFRREGGGGGGKFRGRD